MVLKAGGVMNEKKLFSLLSKKTQLLSIDFHLLSILIF